MYTRTAIFSILLSLLLGGGCDDAKKPQTDAARAPAPVASASTAQAATETKSTDSPKMAPTPGTVTRDTELKDKPFVDAKTLKRLPARTAVTIVDRQGGWLKVTSGGRQGWVRLLHVSSQPAGAGAADELKSAAKVATGRAGSGNIVSTTGIRGLNEEQLSKAQPNPAELQRLASYGANKEQAAAYAAAHKLSRRQIAYPAGPR